MKNRISNRMDRARRVKARGFSLIEVLIAIVIFALGMLGTLAMILNGLKLTTSSTSRTIASEAVAAMAETLRSNPLASGSSDPVTNATFATSTPVIDTDCMNSTGCDRNAFVNHSIQSWQDNLAASLPGGTGVICRDSDPLANETKIRPTATPPWNCDGTGAYVIKVCWNESRIAASKSPAGSQGSFNGGLICTWANI